MAVPYLVLVKMKYKPKGEMTLSRKLLISIIVGIVLIAGSIISYGVLFRTNNYKEQLNLGYKLLNEGKNEEAILAFEKVIKNDPKNVEARIGMGKAYITTNQNDKAEKVLKEAISIDSKKPVPYTELSSFYEKFGRLDHAKDTGTGNSNNK